MEKILTARTAKKMVAKPWLTNKQFAESDPFFLGACKLAGIKPTARQASKFRRGFGAARKAMKGVATNG